VEAQDSAALTLGLNLGPSPIGVPELGGALLQPGLGFPATTYLVRGTANDGLFDYSAGYFYVDVAAGQSAVTVSALNVTLQADPGTVVVDAQGSTHISAAARDRLGHPVPDGTEVLLETTWGLFPNGEATYSVRTVNGQATALLVVEAGGTLARVTATCKSVVAALDLSIESEPGVHTPTPTFTSTPTLTPTPTSVPTEEPGAGAIVDVRHEVDLSGYDRLVGGEDLAQSAAAAMAGTAGGMAVSINDTSAHYGEVRFPALTAPAYRFRFYVDPNGMTMVDWQNFLIASARSGWTERQRVVLLYHKGIYELRLVVRDDGGTTHYSGYHVISDAEHYVEVLVRHASGAASEDGVAALWIDGVQVAQIASLDLYDADKRVDNLQLGAVFGVDAGTRGTLYFDELVLREGEAEIGAVSR